MRTIRWLAAACAVSMLPAVTAAQSQRAFEHSWFWGAKAGINTFSTSVSKSEVAPMVGAEWLITRSKFGLYMAADQTFFDDFSGIDDLAGGEYVVAIKDLKRFTAAGLFFPKALEVLRPYAGIGFAVNWIGDATATTTFTSTDEQNYVEGEIERQKDRASFVFLLGFQTQMRRFAPFAQATLQPSQAGFLLNERPLYLLEGGIRINTGPSREK